MGVDTVYIEVCTIFYLISGELYGNCEIVLKQKELKYQIIERTPV